MDVEAPSSHGGVGGVFCPDGEDKKHAARGKLPHDIQPPGHHGSRQPHKPGFGIQTANP
jgi:hypothetical protein